jgi:hypothetical protein
MLNLATQTQLDSQNEYLRAQLELTEADLALQDVEIARLELLAAAATTDH